MNKFLLRTVAGFFAVVLLSVFSHQAIASLTPSTSHDSDVIAVRQAVYNYMLQSALPGEVPYLDVTQNVYFSRDRQYANAGWLQGEAGGSYLLRKQGNTWGVLCGDGGAFSIDSMVQDCGMPRNAATEIFGQIP